MSCEVRVSLSSNCCSPVLAGLSWYCLFLFLFFCFFFFFHAEDGIRDLVRSRGLGDVYQRQLYVRCCVVANGPVYYEAVLNNPTEMPKDMEFESLLNVSPAAFERKTGEELDHVLDICYESFSNKAGWPDSLHNQ